NYAFYECGDHAKVYYAGSKSDRNAISIGSYNSRLTSATWYYNAIGGVPVTSIGDHAFDSCAYLTNITLPDSVTTIGDYAFFHCHSLTSITLPDSVTFIGDYAFSYCKSLKSITLPDGVTAIGDHAFYECGDHAKKHPAQNQPYKHVYEKTRLMSMLHCPYRTKNEAPGNQRQTRREDDEHVPRRRLFPVRAFFPRFHDSPL
ncbi:MAG: leucine-rich repeat domain-containing protein, partial [Rhodocyclaceae bacterium]|nr:leucine-rich repeat domain-containing protein [Rhodocyclaceae bacterium]